MFSRYFFSTLALLSLLPVQSYELRGQQFYTYPPYQKHIDNPEEFLGYATGKYHTRHDRITDYFAYLAGVSPRIQVDTYGYTYEERPLIIAYIAKASTLKQIDRIRDAHVDAIFGKGKEGLDTTVILYMGYNIHGNEPSSAEAAMWLAYTLVASEHPEIQQYRKHALVILDPVINPDGRDRHTQWVNSRKSKHPIADPYDEEHREAWPRGRTNHYRFDLNRDLLLAVHPESRGRLKIFHRWYPHVYTDFHEMGTDRTYFFEPKRPTARKDPLTPRENVTLLNALFERVFAHTMDSIGELYFTNEIFGSTYPGYGSTYGDLQGGLALLFEQASSRGHVQQSMFRALAFRRTIYHQFIMSLATLKAALLNKHTLLAYQRNFFAQTLDEARSAGFFGYAFGDPTAPTRTGRFIDFLRQHNIEIYQSRRTPYRYIVPLDQPQYRLIRHLFDDNRHWVDSVFYDASAWNLIRAYNLPYQRIEKAPRDLQPLANLPKPRLPKVLSNAYAYIVPWQHQFSPAVAYQLLARGAHLRVATKPFVIPIDADATMHFSYGSLILSPSEQVIPQTRLSRILDSLSRQYQVPIYSVATGLSLRGVDLGSPSHDKVQLPKIALITGEGINAYEAGEVWYTLDYRYDIPVVRLPQHVFRRVPLQRYNRLVFVSGRYDGMSKKDIERLRQWVEGGGVLVLLNNAVRWADKVKLIDVEFVKRQRDTSVLFRPYGQAREDRAKHNVSGVILQTKVDTTHPIAYGYTSDVLAVYKKTDFWMKRSKDPYQNPLLYRVNPLLSGYLSEENLRLHDRGDIASVAVHFIGKGKVICFSDDVLFRGTWWGTEKLFLNAILFGPIIRNTSGGRRW